MKRYFWIILLLVILSFLGMEVWNFIKSGGQVGFISKIGNSFHDYEEFTSEIKIKKMYNRDSRSKEVKEQSEHQRESKQEGI